MFEVLMFLFENYMDGSIALKADNHTICIELERIGFLRTEIDRALDWLDGLNHFQHAFVSHSSSLAKRYLTHQEKEHIGLEGQSLLLNLEQMQILDPITREIVIDRAMALSPRELSLGRIKWVVLMALYNQPEKKPALVLLQDMILADAFNILH